MKKIRTRREVGNGLESDRDYVLNNIKLCAELLERIENCDHAYFEALTNGIESNAGHGE